MVLIVSPAYGRDYATANDAVADWNAGLDFVQHSGRGGTYVSKRDNIEAFGFRSVKICFNRIQDFVVINRDGTIQVDEEQLNEL